MHHFEKIVKRITEAFNAVAGWLVFAAMLLIVINVFMRTVFHAPILGTYEYTGFLTALFISFGLAHCLVLNAHIAIDFFIDKLRAPAQKKVDTAVSVFVLIFMLLFTRGMFQYAASLVKSNAVSSTTQMPLAIFVYIIAVSFVVLCLAFVLQMMNSLKGGRVK